MHFRYAESILARRLLRDAFDVLACVFDVGTESLVDESVQDIETVWAEIQRADDAEREARYLFLDDLKLRDAGHEHREVFGERDA